MPKDNVVSSEQIKSAVRERYGRVAPPSDQASRTACCDASCCCETANPATARGYSPEELADIRKEA